MKKKRQTNKQTKPFSLFNFFYETIDAPNSKARSQKSNLSLIELGLMNNEKRI